MRFLKPTPELIAEMGARLQPKDREDLELPDGAKMAVRLFRDDDGKLQIMAPWLFSDFFPG
jgi:hypothetical protein